MWSWSNIMVITKRGFTLLELMIVVAVLGILASVAYPSYTSAVIRSQRADMRAAMNEIAQSLERYRAQVYSYNPTSPVTVANFLQQSYIFGSSVYPRAGSDRRLSNNVQYDLAIQIVNSGSGYIVSATPRIGSRQDGDGILVIDQLGRTCWSKKDATCSASNNTGTGWNDQ
jgi:type IV pilus assembly protein PilE